MTARSSLIDTFASEITSFGTMTVYLPAALLLERLISGIWMPVLGSLLLTEVLCGAFKVIYPTARPIPRPDKGLYGRYDAGSFPSIHTARAAAFAVSFSLVHPDMLLSWLSAAIVLGVAWSRIRLGHHHLHDVIGGALAGGIIAVATASFLLR